MTIPDARSLMELADLIEAARDDVQTAPRNPTVPHIPLKRILALYDADIDAILSALRTAGQPSTARADALREALDLFVGFGCPVCHGDCASANPPVAACPMIAAREAIAPALPAKRCDVCDNGVEFPRPYCPWCGNALALADKAPGAEPQTITPMPGNVGSRAASLAPVDEASTSATPNMPGERNDRRRFRHVKRGTTYVELGRGELQSGGYVAGCCRMVAYRSEHDRRIWFRPEREFDDGRFVELPPEPAPSTIAEAVRVEREACAKIAEMCAEAHWGASEYRAQDACLGVASRIRARATAAKPEEGSK